MGYSIRVKERDSPMSFISITRRIITATVVLSVIGAVTPDEEVKKVPAVSTPTHLYNLDSKHDYLVEAVKSTGVAFKINPTDCFTEENKDTFGWYWAAKNEMVICQENKSTAGVVSFFTAEDTDTIRHEAQHLIQDCMDGKLNGKLNSVYKSPEKLGKDVLGTTGVAEIKELYSDASAHIQVMEVEAFSVAAMNDPMDQASDVQNFCF